MKEGGCSSASCHRIRGIKRSEQILMAVVCEHKFRSTTICKADESISPVITPSRVSGYQHTRPPPPRLYVSHIHVHAAVLPETLAVLNDSSTVVLDPYHSPIAVRSSRSSRRSAALRLSFSTRLSKEDFVLAGRRFTDMTSGQKRSAWLVTF
jgi:hypothetical protein